MAEFAIREVEGMRQVRMDIRDEAVRANKGAMSNMRGAVTLTPRLPSAGDLFRSPFTTRGAGAAVLLRHRLDPAAALARAATTCWT